MTAPAPKVDNLRGMVWAMISVLGASGMAISMRAATDVLSSNTTVLYRALMMLALTAIGLALFKSLRTGLQFTYPKRHILRGVLFAISVMLGFYAVANIPLTTATVLFFLAPIFASLLSVPLLGQTMGPRRMIATIIGLLGALVILRPGYIPLNLGLISAVGSSVFFAFGLVLTRDLAQKDGPVSTMLSSTIITLLVTFPISSQNFEVPELPMTWFWLVFLALVSILRQVSDIQAYRYAEASVIAPFAYLRLVFIGIGAYFIFDELPDLPTIIGAAIIIGSALYIAQRERSLKKATLPSSRSAPP